MQISVIIPAYNNETTIGTVLATVNKVSEISEVIVVDDGSTDTTRKILQQFKNIIVVPHENNLGKGAAIVSGWKRASHETVLTMDADLSTLKVSHITDIIQEYNTGKYDMVIAAREYSLLFDWVSGERMYRKSKVLPYYDMAKHAGNGIEQIVNFAHRGGKTKIIFSKNIGHVMRYQRGSIRKAIPLYIREGWQLAKTEFLLRTMVQ